MSAAPLVPTRFRLDDAEAIAASVVEELAPYCEALYVAGSVRRRAETVGDVQLVAVPTLRQQVVPLFDDLGLVGDAPPIDELDEHLADLHRAGKLWKRRRPNGATCWGRVLKQLVWPFGSAVADRIVVEIVTTTPTTFGCRLALRTGPAAFAKRLVTRALPGRDGVLALDLEFREGGLYRYADGGRHFVPTPDEWVLFAELGLPYVAPEYRTASTFRPDFRRRP